jgi:hypothetical protein
MPRSARTEAEPARGRWPPAAERDPAARSTRPDREQVLALLADLLADLKYGQIQITVHDSRIVQIDKTERLRFT